MLGTSLKISRFVKLSGLFVFAVLAFSILSSVSYACKTDLIAGRYMDVGDVTVWNDAVNLYVKYQTTGNWFMSATHLDVELVSSNPKYPAANIPQSNGNPIPGQFSYKKDHNPKVTEYIYEIPLNSFPAKANLVIAAHADVCKASTYINYKALAASPSGIFDLSIVMANQSFFSATINEIPYKAYCVDLDNGIKELITHSATATSSYSQYIGSLVKHPENLDLVNYIINNYYVGGKYTVWDIQIAIWTLIDDVDRNDSLWSSINFTNIDEIIADAKAKGEGYIPPIGGYMALIFNPVDANGIKAQTIIALFPVPTKTCYCCETAWGKGCGFPGKNWAMYFKYTIK